MKKTVLAFCSLGVLALHSAGEWLPGGVKRTASGAYNAAGSAITSAKKEVNDFVSGQTSATSHHSELRKDMEVCLRLADSSRLKVLTQNSEKEKAAQATCRLVFDLYMQSLRNRIPKSTD